MPRKLLRRLLPDPQWIRDHSLLAWLGPALHHPRLLHVSRGGIALGTAIGIFFGLLLPIGQMPAAAAAAVVMRANLPVAVAGTFVTNPFTFAPLYYLAYRIGLFITGADQPIEAAAFDANAETLSEWLGFWIERIQRLGKPLIVGLFVMACVSSLTSYFGINWLWRRLTLRAWHRRSALRKAATPK